MIPIQYFKDWSSLMLNINARKPQTKRYVKTFVKRTGYSKQLPSGDAYAWAAAFGTSQK